MTSSGIQSLDEIGVAMGTDKSSPHHDFLHFYDDELSSFRSREFTLLEIGVYHGQSIKMWATYFPNAKVVGVDIDPEVTTRFVPPVNARIVVADATRLEVQDEIVADFGKPLIIIDDGSHLWHHQIEALRYLWPRLLPGGVFIMEDVHTSFPRLTEEYKGCSPVSGFDYLMKLNRWIVGNKEMGDEKPDDGFIANYWPTVRSMHWFRGTCVIHKKKG